MVPNPRFTSTLAIFSAFMSLVYIGLGIFLLTTNYGTMLGPTMGLVVGLVLIAMGLLRAANAYTKYKNLKD
jgi:hypothetical protein